jgi:hypothetical protein
MCVLAVFGWPYAYYQLLRWIVCISAVWTALIASALDRKAWVVALILTGILFNPIAPIHLGREVWFWLDLMAAALLLLSLSVVSEKRVQGTSA